MGANTSVLSSVILVHVHLVRKLSIVRAIVEIANQPFAVVQTNPGLAVRNAARFCFAANMVVQSFVILVNVRRVLVLAYKLAIAVRQKNIVRVQIHCGNATLFVERNSAVATMHVIKFVMRENV